MLTVVHDAEEANGSEPGRSLLDEIVRDGKTLATSKQVTVKAGEETRVTIEIPVASVASK